MLALHRLAPLSGLPPFQCGAAGLLAYEWGSQLDELPQGPPGDSPFPDTLLGVYDWVIAWDHHAGTAWAIASGYPEIGPARESAAARRAGEVVAWVDRVRVGGEPGDVPGAAPDEKKVGLIGRGGPPTGSLPPDCPITITDFPLHSTFSRASYESAVERIREYILAGDLFQANLSQRFSAPLPGDGAAWRLYEDLRFANPVPFAAFLDAGSAQIVSASPERFLRVDADGTAETRPIKGTRPRGNSPVDDARLGAELLASAKDRAENIMIVDLLRNDFSRVCAPGSVRAVELCALERYSTVQHLVSTICGVLEPGHDAVALVAACFPSGSVTGAPRLRAMEIIGELEPVARGPYSGSLVWLSCTGALDSSVLIRTVVIANGRVTFSAGGGVVLGSEPAAEYDETLAKATGLVRALASATLSRG